MHTPLRSLLVLPLCAATAACTLLPYNRGIESQQLIHSGEPECPYTRLEEVQASQRPLLLVEARERGGEAVVGARQRPSTRTWVGVAVLFDQERCRR